ncbi:PGF-pre-PGF domain-containing protein [Candidatus Pacearchaeota archaeon]|nr:PGF-pre-PGF domain-containing protein [Candidatus Pacearchaeota archaeon]
MAKSNLPVKVWLFSLAVLFGVIFLMNFVSASGLAMRNPGNGTNFTKTNVLVNVSYTNDTILTSPTNITIWASPNGNGTMLNVTSRVIGTCTANACWTLVNFTSIADGNYSINVTLYNLTSGSADVIITNNLSSFVRFDSTPPNVSAFTAPINAQNISQNVSGNFTINVSIVDSTLLVQAVYFNITNITGTQVYIANATNPSGNFWNATLNTHALGGEGVYNVTIYANDTVNNLNNSRALANGIRIDGTRPRAAAANFSGLANGQNLTGTFMLNISVSDDNSSIGSVMFNITNSSGAQNLTLFTTNPTGNVWNVSFNTANFLGGVYNITAYVNDTAGNQNNTAKVFTVRFDNTVPSVSTFSCTPDPVQKDATITCSCTGSDDDSGINITTYTTNPSTSETGSISTSCTVSNHVGLSASSTIQYRVNQAPGSSAGSGGGGSSTTAPSKKVVNTLDKITPGAAAIVKNFDKEYGVKEITIDVNNPAQNVKITVSKYDGKPAEVSVEKSGNVYKYLQISAENVQDKLSKAIVRIQVEKSWANGKSLAKDKISMFKFINGDWKELPTTFKEEDATNYYYDVELLSFSFFAIGEKVQEQVVTPEEATTVSEPTAPPVETEKTSNAAVTGVIIGIIILIVIIGAVIFFIQKKKKKFW